MMSDDEDDGFWQELASDIANGLNDEKYHSDGSFCESGSESDSESSPLVLNKSVFEPNRTENQASTTTLKKKKCDDATSHYHCYCLRSKDPRHPYKNYVGFTTNPERRLKQHNGILKNGGAWKTRRSGRPWEFVVLVSGFPTHKMALQFEWAWQHPGKSLLVRAAIGEKAARTLQRKRATPGEMCKLKTLLECCPDLYERNKLALNFLHEESEDLYRKTVAMPVLPPAVVAANMESIQQVAKKRTILSTAADAEGLPPAPPLPEAPAATVQVISSLKAMPFWTARKKKPPKVKRCVDTGNNDNSPRLSRPDDASPPDAVPDESIGESDEIVNDATASSVTEATGEDAKKIGNKENRKSLGDIYRRCRDFEFLEDSSSSEDDQKVENKTCTECNAYEEEISLLTTSLNEIQMSTLSNDSVSSSDDWGTNTSMDCGKDGESTDSGVLSLVNKATDTKTKRTEMVNVGKRQSSAILMSVISICDDSEDSSSNFSTQPFSGNEKHSRASKKGTHSPEGKTGSLAARDVDHSDCLGCEESDGFNNQTRQTSPLEEKIDAMMADVEESPSDRDGDPTRGPFAAFGVTTRRLPKPKKSSSVPTVADDACGGDFSCIADDGKDGCSSFLHGNSLFLAPFRPSLADRPRKTKRISIVDLCSP
eukprot:CAMPEP_0197178552 /NCGR_PEP_ID=MMETSP1423-20130617/3800_1 /TAXON_ID=476441 /ORGANISM="Pseudo-nitzschia heimii, Strain UNC1101" /LENGTH=652 /DNA_ID=CAMNT_0042628323 /DNA_START=98 /DNA_END=2056 /DNA_ORIENTATION=+